ncbi:transposase [Polymorphobacter megasporae]|uniref:transposase n=1 Tax=Glacieibacterium megasporae TaxID=2835787 RepID=UPI001C1E6D90|nr:transposase [Polymorphobacter megasporae]
MARRNGICPSQLFTWRRQLRRPVETAEPLLFVPAIVEREAAPAPLPAQRQQRRRLARRGSSPAAIEVSMDGISVRIGRGADATLIAAVSDALKGSR